SLKMTERLEQRYCIKFCQNFGILDIIEKVRALIMKNRRLAIREVADEAGISRGSANTILTEDLGMRRVAAKSVPKLLLPEQQLRLEVAQDMLEEYYQEVLRHLRDAVRRKKPELLDARNWQLHHDNAPAHSSHLIQGFLAKHGIPQVRQAPYSPDMAPCDFWLFSRLKTPLKAAVLTAARTTYRTRRRRCTQIQKKPSRIASSDGRTAELSEWSHKEPTFEGD
ncbi:hypothetical protein B7P43_G03939, partial [Cryptotermes secundus]